MEEPRACVGSRWKLSLAAAGLCFGSLSAASGATGYVEVDLVSDLPAVASQVDARLQNPWGLASSSTSPIWVADNALGISTLYDGAGTAQSLAVSFPAGVTRPTGVVFNPTGDFELAPGMRAIFLFATADGATAGWNPAASPPSALIETLPAAGDYTAIRPGATGAP